MSSKDTVREEHITCIAHDHADYERKTWCGADADGREFTSVDHAAYNGLSQGRYMVCRECLEAVVKALCNGYGDE